MASRNTLNVCSIVLRLMGKYHLILYAGTPRASKYKRCTVMFGAIRNFPRCVPVKSLNQYLHRLHL